MVLIVQELPVAGTMPLSTGRYTIHHPDRIGVTVEGHASYRGAADLRTSAGVRQQVGSWTLTLAAEAWPVSEVDTVVHDETGTPYKVNSAALRPGLGTLAHVTVDADLATADSSDELGVDAEGNVQAIPQRTG